MTFWDYFTPCAASFIACLGFCITFNFHNWKHSVASSLVGALGWYIYLLFAFTGNDILQFFIATIAISICSEILARLFKAPVTGFVLVALLPLVPGGGIYYTMRYCIAGNIPLFIEKCLHTFGIAGAIAVGVMLVSSSVRLLTLIHTTKAESTGVRPAK